jgi:cytochrome oxidase assembly protein ShyY1
MASKPPQASSASPVTPAGHRGYAATWFSLAAIAMVIYGLVLRKRLREESAKP